MTDRRPSPAVCMVTFSMPPEHSGAARQAITLAGRLSAAGVRVFFVTMRSTDEATATEISGFRVVRIPKRNRREKAVAPLRVFMTLFGERRNFSVVHVHGVGYLSTVVVLFARLFGKASIIKMTMFSEDDPLSVQRRRFGRITYAFMARASRVIAITESFARSAVTAGIPEPQVARIPNGVDTVRFRPVGPTERAELRERLGLPASATLLAFAGIVRPEKGIDFLLDVMEIIGRTRRDVVLVYLGPVESWLPEHERRFADEQIARMAGDPLRSVVQFRAGVHNVNEYFQASDIFVTTSRKEGFPNVLLEGMACGLPAIARDIPDIYSNVLENGVDGLVLKDPAADSFARTVLGLVDDAPRRRRMGEAALAKVTERYSIDAVTERYLSLYSELIR